MLDHGSELWRYLSETQRQLASDGMLLIEDREHHPNDQLSDYSYLVFPFAKLYEGFLKQLFRDLSIISEREYESTHFRLGKVLSPNLVRRLRTRSAYGTVASKYGEDLAETLWYAWKQGRNLVFHYFPHNVTRLNFAEAKQAITMVVRAMEKAVERTKPIKRVKKIVLATATAGGVS